MSNFNEGDLFHERYKLLQYLGGGELSEVWRSHDQLSGIEVALKIYVRVGDAGIKQFIKDFTLTEALAYPYILKPHHVDVCDRRPYLILKFCTKGSVSNRIDDTNEFYKPFDEKEIAIFMVQIGGSLSYLHKNEILHRDVKPDNILLADNGDFLLTDFGISKKVRTTLTKATSSTQVVSFSRPYAPPEILTGIDDPKKDVFSLGVTMYELLTEDLPFEGNGGTVLLMGGKVPDLSEKFSVELNNILKKCMNKDLVDRPTSSELESYGNTFLKTGKWPTVTLISNAEQKAIADKKNKAPSGPSAISVFLEKTGQNIGGITKNIVPAIQNVGSSVGNILKPNPNSSPSFFSKNKIFILGGSVFLAVLISLYIVFKDKLNAPKTAETTIVLPSATDTTNTELPQKPSESSVSDDEYNSLMQQAQESFAKKDYKAAMQFSEDAWVTKNTDEAKKLYELAKNGGKTPDPNAIKPTAAPDQNYIDRGYKELQQGNYGVAMNFYKMACAGKKNNAVCVDKIDECRSLAQSKCTDLIKQGEDIVRNNKQRAMTYFKEAKDLASSTEIFVSQFSQVYEVMKKRGDAIFENEEFKDAKEWYLVAQVLNNTGEIQQKIQQCNK